MQKEWGCHMETCITPVSRTRDRGTSERHRIFVRSFPNLHSVKKRSLVQFPTTIDDYFSKKSTNFASWHLKPR